MAKVNQEFYCNECDGYIRVRLNTALNRRVVVRCPNCGHQHSRRIYKGVLEDTGLHSFSDEEICPPKSAYSKKSLLAPRAARNGVVIEERDPRMRALWFERFAHRL